MSPKARIFWLAIIVSGCATACVSLILSHPHAKDLPTLLLYVAAAACSSGMKVRLPRIYSTLSMNYVFIIAGLLDLHVGSGILIGTVGVICQSFYHCKQRPKLTHLSFNVAAVSLSVAAAGFLYQNHWLRMVDQFGICSIVSSCLVFFCVNTTVLSTMIALTSGKSPCAVWQES